MIGFPRLNWDEIARDVRAVFRRYGGWFACAITAIVLWTCLHFLPLFYSTNDEGTRYLLSAISQGLAAILALIFTITLIAAQMTRRYTAMDRMFNLETILLMLIFSIGIVLPLVILKVGRSIYVNECIALAAFCVLSLIPHLKSVNATLKYDLGIIIENLGEELMDAIERGRETTAINRIRDLEQIGVDASKDREEDAIEDVLRLLKVAGKKSKEKGFEDTAYRVVKSLSGVGKRAAENNWERATRNSVVGLINIAKSVDSRWKYLIESAIEGVIDIGVISAKKRWKGVVRNASGFLEKVSVNSVFTEEWLDSASGLWILGAAVEKYLGEIIDELIHGLHERESSTSNDFFKEAFDRAREDINLRYLYLKPSFEEFKRRYDMSQQI